MTSHGTSNNFLKVYGGHVSAKDAKLSDTGELIILFSRPVVFPQNLLVGLDSATQYVETVPAWPTEEILDELKENATVIFTESKEANHEIEDKIA